MPHGVDRKINVNELKKKQDVKLAIGILVHKLKK